MQNLLTFSRLRTETSKRMPLIIKLQIRHLDLFLKRCKITTFPEYMQTIINMANIAPYRILTGDTYFEYFLLIININILLYICLYLVNLCLYFAEEKNHTPILSPLCRLSPYPHLLLYHFYTDNGKRLQDASKMQQDLQAFKSQSVYRTLYQYVFNQEWANSQP